MQRSQSNSSTSAFGRPELTAQGTMPWRIGIESRIGHLSARLNGACHIDSD